jgi:PIN domain nuclease of toxin-antitoxin system
VKLLLDTHVLLWALLEPQKLPPAWRNALGDSDSTVVENYTMALHRLAAQAKADQLVLASTDQAFAQFEGVVVFGQGVDVLPH